MEPNYCLPLIKDRRIDVLDAIRANIDNYRYFEVWLDYVQDIDETFADELAGLLGGRLVAVFRRQNLEAPVMEAERRRGLLDRLGSGPVLVDLDITTQKTELDHLKASGVAANIITSYHNYEETPDTLQLREIIATMDAYQPAVYKLSTRCATEEDAVRLLEQLLELKARDVRAIVSGMGRHGAVTRIFGTLWGNEMVFAPLTAEEQSAPGQLTRQQLETIFKELGK